jgi:FHA domain
MYEKFCPACKKKNNINVTICTFCGASLKNEVAKHSINTGFVYMDMNTATITGVAEHHYVKSLAIPDRGISLYLINNSQPITTREEREFIMGRELTDLEKGEGVDLASFGGYENGVSKRHAMIRRMENQYEILDLKSTNGTFLNNKRISPNTAYSLTSGSRICLGVLKLYVVFKDIGAGVGGD